jgi:hypothetical protein
MSNVIDVSSQGERCIFIGSEALGANPLEFALLSEILLLNNESSAVQTLLTKGKWTTMTLRYTAGINAES